jgi:hypothetical protein
MVYVNIFKKFCSKINLENQNHTGENSYLLPDGIYLKDK